MLGDALLMRTRKSIRRVEIKALILKYNKKLKRKTENHNRMSANESPEPGTGDCVWVLVRLNVKYIKNFAITIIYLDPFLVNNALTRD